jgi:hypothetical protein
VAAAAVGVVCACQAPPARHAATPDEVAGLCAGIPDSERDHPSALQPPELEGVRSAMGERRYIKFTRPELRGAELLVRPDRGISKQWLTRVVRCHVAYHDVAGSSLQESSPDPLVVNQPEITVDETDTCFVIRIKGSSKAEGEEILARAQRLVSPTQSAPR